MTRALDATDWAQVRRIYEQRPEIAVTRIQRDFGVSKDAFYERANAEGWKKRGGLTALARSAGAAGAARPRHAPDWDGAIAESGDEGGTGDLAPDAASRVTRRARRTATDDDDGEAAAGEGDGCDDSEGDSDSAGKETAAGSGPRACAAAATRRRSVPRWTGRAHRQLLERLRAAVLLKLAQLEDRMSDDTIKTPADAERETRELGALVRNAEKVSDLASDIADARHTGPKSAERARSAEDAERLRLEIAARILRFAGRDAG